MNIWCEHALCLKQLLSSVHFSRVSQEVSRSVSRHSSSGLSLSLLCFFSRQTDDDQITSLCGAQKYHWIITINGQMNVWKCKLIFLTDTLQQKIERTDLKPFFSSKYFGLHCMHALPTEQIQLLNLQRSSERQRKVQRTHRTRDDDDDEGHGLEARVNVPLQRRRRLPFCSGV